MADVDGAYDCLTKTPMGDQQSVFTVISSGDRFNGTNAGPLGSLDVKDGKVDGNRLTWVMEMTMGPNNSLPYKSFVRAINWNSDHVSAVVDVTPG